MDYNVDFKYMHSFPYPLPIRVPPNDRNLLWAISLSAAHCVLDSRSPPPSLSLTLPSALWFKWLVSGCFPASKCLLSVLLPTEENQPDRGSAPALVRVAHSQAVSTLVRSRPLFPHVCTSQPTKEKEGVTRVRVSSRQCYEEYYTTI